METKQRYRELSPIVDHPADYDAIENEIRAVLLKSLYEPIFRLVSNRRRVLPLFQNAKRSALEQALREGRITFGQGLFAGKFDAATSRELKTLGAKWDATRECFRLTKAQLPKEIVEAAELGTGRFLAQLKKADALLQKILPAKIAGKMKLAKHFDTAIFKVDRRLTESLTAVTVEPKLSKTARRVIAEEWEDNARLFIANFAEKEVKRLRAQIKEHAFSGGRFEHVQEAIRSSFGVTENKAKFLARQETSLLMSKFKKARYTEAGSLEYKWRCVAGSPRHPVRPSHKKLDGSIQRWDSPPITTPPGQALRRCHPGEDFNCRCTAIPIVRF